MSADSPAVPSAPLDETLPCPFCGKMPHRYAPASVICNNEECAIAFTPSPLARWNSRAPRADAPTAADEGPYTGRDCALCGRVRVELATLKCEKCGYVNDPKGIAGLLRLRSETPTAARRASDAPTAPPPFPDGSYEIPLERRLEAASVDFGGHPRLGLSPSDKHSIPLTSAEGRQLLALLRDAPTADGVPSGHRRAVGVAASGDAGPMDWPEDFAHENGRYFNSCHNCACIFVGHKRRATCRVCAAPPAARRAEPSDALVRLFADQVSDLVATPTYAHATEAQLEDYRGILRMLLALTVPSAPNGDGEAVPSREQVQGALMDAIEKGFESAEVQYKSDIPTEFITIDYAGIVGKILELLYAALPSAGADRERDALEAQWREKARLSLEESSRIRKTIGHETDAEMRCVVRADCWKQCADQLAALPSRSPETAPQEGGA